jgi:hypothetical protein
MKEELRKVFIARDGRDFQPRRNAAHTSARPAVPPWSA